MPKDRSYSLRCSEEGPQGATGWRSSPDPTDKQTVDKGPMAVPAQALELMSGFGARTRPTARRGKGLQLNQTNKVQAG